MESGYNTTSSPKDGVDRRNNNNRFEDDIQRGSVKGGTGAIREDNFTF